MKMPEPIIDPITIMVASMGPRARTKRLCCSSSRQRAVLRRKKNQFCVDLGDGTTNRLSQFAIAHRHVIKRAVRFHVIWTHAGRIGDRLKNAKLIDDSVENFV